MLDDEAQALLAKDIAPGHDSIIGPSPIVRELPFLGALKVLAQSSAIYLGSWLL